MSTCILWRRLDEEGHEAARLVRHPSAWLLSGVAAFASEGAPCQLAYQVTCDLSWRTTGAMVSGWVGEAAIELAIAVDEAGRWWLDGSEIPAVAGCVDIDLSFSPATNLLPIRRLALDDGERAAVRAAWLTFPSIGLAPLEQVYRRRDASSYRYESDGGRFTAELRVAPTGFITSYPGLWEAVVGGA